MDISAQVIAANLPCELVSSKDAYDVVFFWFDPNEWVERDGLWPALYVMGWLGSYAGQLQPVWVVMPPEYKDGKIAESVSDWLSVRLAFNSDRIAGLGTLLRKHFVGLPYPEYLQTPHWQEVREAALKAADYRCQVCYSPDKVQVHHRTYDRRGRELPSDVTVLCDTCHGLYHSRMRKGGE
jgi:hypothetical protein